MALHAVTWRSTINLSAVIDSEQNATLAAERAGRVIGIYYQSGETVSAGTVLVKLDDAPEAAQLALDNAKLTEARDALAREQKLITIAGASRAALEQAEADAAEAQAQVAYDEAVLAQLNIVAPFAGQLGIRKLAMGDYVQQGQAVASITQTAALRVLFSIPQTEAAGIAVGDGFTFSTPSQAGTMPGIPGRISALSPQIDPSTNARDAEGKITANAGNVLPGMYGTVTLSTGAPQPAFAFPSSALNDSPLGPFIFVLDPTGGHYALRAVYVTKLGDSAGNTYAAAKGLQGGELVLETGGFNLPDGASVTLQTR